MISTDTLNDAILSAGCSHFGVGKPGPLPEDFEHFKTWLASGSHAGMEYLERPSGLESRLDPSLLFPEARSIIVLGMRYPVDREEDTRPGLRGKVSSYAWGSDYHNVLKGKLDHLAEKIGAITGMEHHYRIAIDSAPILEKPIASKAGLGWFGRNSCLIHPSYGSFFFLANLFTTLDIEPTMESADTHCGTCHRCVDACPTGCIGSDRTIDARRCVSYLTIENKGAIPPELREMIGQRLFGCDVCQSVCPWNKKPDDSLVPAEFLPQSESDIWFDLTYLSSLSEPEFKEKFKQSPLSRAKQRGLARNACVILGNTHDLDAVPVLSQLLQNHPDALIRRHAAWGLGRISSMESRANLSTVRKAETDPDVLSEIDEALAAI